MRKYILVYLFFTAFPFNVFAEDSREVQIKLLVEKIQQAKAEDRRALINQLKLKLREINQKIRDRTVTELKKSLSRRRGVHHHKRFHRHRGDKMHRHRHHRGHR